MKRWPRKISEVGNEEKKGDVTGIKSGTKWDNIG